MIYPMASGGETQARDGADARAAVGEGRATARSWVGKVHLRTREGAAVGSERQDTNRARQLRGRFWGSFREGASAAKSEFKKTVADA